MKNNYWQNTDNEIISQLNYRVAEWLLEFGSLTEKLRRNGETEIEVLLQENYQLSDKECEALNHDGTELLVREVVLSVNKKPWVFARTVINQASESLIQSLGNKPLGSILFSDQNLQRQFLKINKINHESTLFERVSGTSAKLTKQELWARRSLWANQSKQSDSSKMLVTEVFLPDSPLYQE